MQRIDTPIRSAWACIIQVRDMTFWTNFAGVLLVSVLQVVRSREEEDGFVMLPKHLRRNKTMT
jgi:hypothetical protein